MAEQRMKRALIAVYDKTGIVEFARALVDEFGIEIISTGGDAKHLAAAKNHRHVWVVSGDPAFYQITLGHLRMWNQQVHRDDALVSGAFCALDTTASYDAAVATWLGAMQMKGESCVRYLRLWNCERL